MVRNFLAVHHGGEVSLVSIGTLDENHMSCSRRMFLASGLAFFPFAYARAQSGHGHHEGLYERLQQPGRIGKPEVASIQNVFDSPAAKAADPGRWMTKAPLPLPRSEMAWATEHAGRMHLVGGYAEQRVDRPYHHVYDPANDQWTVAAPLPRGANHVGVAVMDGRLYAIGGFVEQNRRPHNECFAYEIRADRWERIAPLPAACGSVACVAFGRSITRHRRRGWRHVRLEEIGRLACGIRPEGRPVETARSIAHRTRSRRRARNSKTHPCHRRAGRQLSHQFQFAPCLRPARDTWEQRQPLPTARSGHGAVLYRGRIFVMGGEGTNRVFGQNEAYDPQSDSWEQYAPMPTPRHGLGAVAIEDAIYVAGGGPVMGGGIQSAVHEAFTLG